MSQDQAQRSHKPTPKRIREFRKRGDIAVSKEITTTATMLGGATACILIAQPWASEVSAYMQRAAQVAGDYDLRLLIEQGASVFLVAFIPIAAGGLFGWTVAASVQLGWPPAFKKPQFNPLKPFSASSILNVLSPKAASLRAFQSTAKVILVFAVLVLAMQSQLDEYLSKPSVEAKGVLLQMGESAVHLGSYALLVFGGMAAFDFVMQSRRMQAKIKMTSEEIKREHKEQDGDPLIRGQRRKRMRALAQRRLAQVPTADVVLVNPTEYAVALRYQEGNDQAPKVIVKGRGAFAESIRTAARTAGVPILSRPPLTRLLYKLVPEGAVIPEQVYKAVAEVLAYIYRLRRRHA